MSAPPEHVDVLIVGAGHFRHRRGLSSEGALPEQELPDPRGARTDRRHLGSVPLSRHPLRFRHVHAWASRSGRGGARRRSSMAPSIRAYVEDTAREHGVDGRDPLRPQARSAPTGRRPRRAGRSKPKRTARRGASPASFLYLGSGYYDYESGYRPEWPRRSRLSPGRSSIRNSGPTISMSPARASS